MCFHQHLKTSPFHTHLSFLSFLCWWTWHRTWTVSLPNPCISQCSVSVWHRTGTVSLSNPCISQCPLSLILFEDIGAIEERVWSLIGNVLCLSTVGPLSPVLTVDWPVVDDCSNKARFGSVGVHMYTMHTVFRGHYSIRVCCCRIFIYFNNVNYRRQVKRYHL